ncbi:hypothetical protein AAG570_000732 [Ranatra chinensis]|uniref:ABC transmembrane type-1 domain-containing protein n=1 Tax=Ranatra chinensis TaxID=642074 RepID=A0ABD0ZL72_9HEMI
MESDKKKEDKPKNPRSIANPLSALTFSWTLPIFWKGYRHDLEVGDLFEPLKEHKSTYLGDKFEKVWNEEVKKCSRIKKDPSFLKVIIAVFGWEILAYGILLFVAEIILRIAQPLFLGGLIDHFTPESKVSKYEAYLYATGIILCSAITVLSMHPYMMGIMHIGMKVRVAACSLIYRKALKLSKTALGQTTVGQVVNLLSNDVNRFDIAFIFLHNLWIGPLQTCIVTYFLWQLIGGPASIIGLFSLLIFIPLQGL